MSESLQPLTIRAMATRLNVEEHCVRYVVQSRKIPSVTWIGHTRLFSQQAFAEVQRHLQQIQLRKATGTPQSSDPTSS